MKSPKQKLAIIGAKGMLAQMVQQLAGFEWDISPLDLPEFDLTNRDMVHRVLLTLQPDVIINCAAFTNVDGCETAEETATLVNGTAVGWLATVAREIEATLVHISTDYVFDGRKDEPYVETDTPNPVSAYGRSKLRGEQALLASGLTSYFIIRTSWLYGPGGNNFVETILRLAKERTQLRIVADQQGTPTYTGDLAAAIFQLLSLPSDIPGGVPFGVYHFSPLGQCCWYEFACEIVRLAQGQGMTLAVEKVVPIATQDYPLPAQRPAYSVFSKDKYLQATGAQLPGWRESLKRYFELRALDTDKDLISRI